MLIVYQEQMSTVGISAVLNFLPYTDIAVRIIEDSRIFLNFDVSPLTIKGVILERNSSTVKMFSKFCDANELNKKFLTQKGMTKQPY